MHFDPVKFGAEVGALIAPLRKRLDALEALPLPAAPEVPDVRAAVAEAVAALPPPERGAPGDPGRSVEPAEVERMLEGIFGRWALEFERRAADVLAKVVERMPVPKDGKDGLSADDFEVTHDGERTLTFALKRGPIAKEWTVELPVVLDRGTYTEGREYKTGDGVTWAGSFWIAQRATGHKPEGADSGWRLAVKRGRDGKEARRVVDPPKGMKL